MNNRRLDTLIAEHVFNWQWETLHQRLIFVPPIDDDKRNWTAMWDQDGIPHFLPKYSTNISDAWKVVENFEFAKIEYEEGYAYVEFWEDDKELGSYGDQTLPLAICRAALKSHDVII